MERQVGTLEVHIGPDQLDELVLGDAAFAAVEGEDGLRLPGAGLLTTPAAYQLAVVLPRRAYRENVQAGWGRHRLVQGHALVGPACQHCLALADSVSSAAACWSLRCARFREAAR